MQRASISPASHLQSYHGLDILFLGEDVILSSSSPYLLLKISQKG